MMQLVMTDSGDPLTTSSGSAVTRRGRPGDVTATGADREEGCGGRAFGDAGAAYRRDAALMQAPRWPSGTPIPHEKTTS